MQRANSAVLRQISQRFLDAVGQLVYGNDCFLIADQRQIDPSLDIRAQQTDLLQILNVQCLCVFFFQKPVDLKQLGLHERDHLVHEPVLFFNLRAQIEEKNRLMDEMIALVQPQLLQINRLLEEENAQALNVQNLKQVCLLGAYVKRRVNLALICDQKTVVPVDELAHCIQESLTYLTQYGAVCALHQEGKGSVSSRDVQTAYDFFEDCLEAALPSLSALMVRVECSERFSIRLMMEDAAGLPKADKYRALGKLTIDDADGALCATLSPDWGGVRA